MLEQRVLQQRKHLQRKKLQRKPSSTEARKKVRLKFAEERVHWTKKWKRVLFSDEKKFNGPGITIIVTCEKIQNF